VTSSQTDSPAGSSSPAPTDERDRFFFCFVAALFLALINLPALTGYLVAPPVGSRFVGTTDRYPADLYYHMSFATQVARGGWLMEDKYNGSRVRTKAFPNLLFGLIGLAERLGLPADAAYHLTRNAVAIGLLGVVAALTRRVIRSREGRRLGLILATFGSGFAGVLGLSGYVLSGTHLPYDAWYDAVALPHGLHRWAPDSWVLEFSSFELCSAEFVAPAVMILTLCFWLRAPREESWRSPASILRLGLLPLLIGLTHPHDIVNVFVTSTVLLLWSLLLRQGAPWLSARSLFLILPALPVYLAHAYVLVRDPIIREYAALRDPTSTLQALLGLGLPVMVTCLALPALLRMDWSIRALAVAVLCGLFLFSLPVPLLGQWYNLHGLQVMVSLLAVAAVDRLRSAPSLRRTLFLLLLALSPWTAVSGAVWQMSRVVRRAPQLFRPVKLFETLAAMRWSVPDSGVVLTDAETAELVPYLAGCRVFFGKPEQTAGYGRSFQEFQDWLEAPSVDLGFLHRNEISHLLLTPAIAERLGPDRWRALLSNPGLRCEPRAGPYRLCRVDPSGLPGAR
jgi:hypothetical protein